MVDFELYKIFVVVANEQNMGKASKSLGIPQFTISKNIKLLEKTLKIKLFKKVESNLILTESGNQLYQKLKNPISELIYIDNQYSAIKNINVGAHSRLLDKIFINCINQFYLEYPKVNLSLNNYETDEMLKLLSNKELDIVFSKKVDNHNYSNLKFIKLGYLNDIFVTSQKSDFYGKTLSIKDLKNEIIHVPRSYSQTLNRLVNIIDIQNLNLKCCNYDNILKIIRSSHSIGFLTKEYLDPDAFKKYHIAELHTELNLKPVEFGIYLNNSRFKELNDFIRVIKSHFFFKDF